MNQLPVLYISLTDKNFDHTYHTSCALSFLPYNLFLQQNHLVPDEFERTLVEALEDENIFHTRANVITIASGDCKIPVVASKGTASWIDEKGAIPESDDSFGQVTIGAL